MKRQLIFLVSCLSALMSLCSVDYPDSFTIVGSTESSAVGKTENKDNLVLYVKSKGEAKSIFLENFEMLGNKGISISADIKLDAEGNIISYDNVVIKGIAAKIKSAKGVLLPNKVDAILSGKALGVFNFTIHYMATK